MPLIQVTMIEGRTDEQKRALLEAITRVVHETVDAPLDSIRAWIVDVRAEQFMSAGTLTSEQRAAAEAAADTPPLPASTEASPVAAADPPIDPIMAPGGSQQLP